MGHNGTTGFKRTIPVSDVDAMLDAAKSERDRILIFLMSRTGCRIGEAVIFLTSGIKQRDGILAMPNLKRRSLPDGTPVQGEKEIAVTDDVTAALLAYAEAEGISRGQFLFQGRSKGHLSIRQARNIIYDTAEIAGVTLNKPGEMGVKRIWPHVFRHTYATLLIKSGWDISEVSEQLGHSNITVTKLYTHSDPAHRRQLIQNVPL